MSTTEATKVFKVMGTTSDVTECQHCGRVDLKGTIILGYLDADGNVAEVTYFGAVCGAKAAGWTTKEFRKAAKTADDERRDAERAAVEERCRIFCKARDKWVAENIGPDALTYPKRYGYRSTVQLVTAFSEATGIWN